MATTAQLRKLISEILDAADLTSITAKKVRQELEAKLDTDLTDKKKEIDNLVLEILNEKQKGNGKKESASEESEEDEAPKKKRAKKASSEDESDDEAAKKKKPAAKGGKKGGTGYTKMCKLSPELAKVMGEESMARHEVVKKMWALIKEKNLADPKNRQFAICNDELLPVFGIKRFRTFGMMKYLKNHFLD